ncbi:hypothetical protein Bbelb_239330 [Branchiostoma belcheri]|nr:hypothetical protein Bbelb_239330 [Branchiostoma belcheri]
MSTSLVGNAESNTSPSAYPVGAKSASHPLGILLESTDECYKAAVTSRYNWFFTRDPTAHPAGNARKTTATLTSPTAITSNKPETTPSSSLHVFITSSCSMLGIVLMGTIILALWYKNRARHPPLGLNPNVVGSNTDTAVSVMNNVDDQSGQGQSLANTQCPEVGNISHGHELAGFAQNAMRVGLETTPKQVEAARLAISHNMAGKSQSRTNTESNTNTTATVMRSGHDQAGQDQCPGIPESLDARNRSYGTGPTALQANSRYKTATVMTCGNVQTGQSQSNPEATTESLPLNASNISYDTQPAASQLNSLYVNAETP